MAIVKKTRDWDFPGGPVVWNSLCNAEDTGLIPGQGTKILNAAKQPSPCAITKDSMHCSEDPDVATKTQYNQINKIRSIKT